MKIFCYDSILLSNYNFKNKYYFIFIIYPNYLKLEVVVMMNQYFVAIRSTHYPEAKAVWFFQEWYNPTSLKNVINKVINDDGFYVARVVRTKKNFHRAYSDAEYLRNAINSMHRAVEEIKKEKKREKRKEQIKKVFGFFMRPESACCYQ